MSSLLATTYAISTSTATTRTPLFAQQPFAVAEPSTASQHLDITKQQQQYVYRGHNFRFPLQGLAQSQTLNEKKLMGRHRGSTVIITVSAITKPPKERKGDDDEDNIRVIPRAHEKEKSKIVPVHPQVRYLFRRAMEIEAEHGDS
jgi:hypothetical protein